MNRRKFFKNTALTAAGASLLSPLQTLGATPTSFDLTKGKKAKNIILLVSDGMSNGTLQLADLLHYRKTGLRSKWLDMYENNMVSRALMETASASSLVTDSAAAGSAWGGGVRVPNGKINTAENGEEFMPLWQKFKKAGKKAGTVTTVPATHATPAGFCVNSESRHDQQGIAQKYLDQRFDVIMGSGARYFTADSRNDGRDMFDAFAKAGYSIAKNRKELKALDTTKPVLGIFGDNALPYAIDREHESELAAEFPTLAEMTETAINSMKDNAQGFVLMVEAGKVDWAAHANDVAGLLYDQIEFDQAVKTAMEFAEQDGETLVIITTDHGNANPGLIYGSDANEHFDTIMNYKHSNEWILNDFDASSSLNYIKERMAGSTNVSLTDDQAKVILDHYRGLKQTYGTYNPSNLPYKLLGDYQEEYNSIGWISTYHSADYVELAMYGPGSDLLKPFVKNTDLHYLMLQAAEVENKF